MPTVRSAPAGASVNLDGELMGMTPLTARDVPAGRHRLLLTLPWYADNSQAVEMTAGSDREVQADFGRKAPGFAAVAPAAILLLPTRKDT